MLAKIPEEIFRSVFNSRPTFFDGFPQPPTVSPFGDEALQNAEIHLSVTCLVEITYPCAKPVKYIKVSFFFTRQPPAKRLL